MSKRKNSAQTVNDILKFIFGSVFNLAIIVVTVFFVYTGFYAGFKFGGDFVQAPKDDSPDVTITLEKDTSLEDVASILAKNKIIPNALLFTLENKLSGSKSNYLSGTFVLNANMDTVTINKVLRAVESQTNDVKITIKEGFSTDDIGLYLQSKNIVNAIDFNNACNLDVYDYDFLIGITERDKKLEGYLFPDTYLVAEETDSSTIINKMLLRFDEIFTDEMKQKADEMGLSIDQVVTMASLIEEEAHIDEEKPILASVLFNRIENNMTLNIPSTVVYFQNKRLEALTHDDLDYDSLYNTYIYKDLPFGPINNPSLTSINAVLNPATTDYLYFIIPDDSTNVHLFTNNEEEYLQIKEEKGQIY